MILGLFFLRASQAPGPETPTNRSDLLLDPSEGDACDAYVPGSPGRGDCSTDGHYLCLECSRMSRKAMLDRMIDLPDEVYEAALYDGAHVDGVLDVPYLDPPTVEVAPEAVAPSENPS